MLRKGIGYFHVTVVTTQQKWRRGLFWFTVQRDSVSHGGKCLVGQLNSWWQEFELVSVYMMADQEVG